MPDADARLRELGFDGQRLQNLAYKVANDYTRRTGSGLDIRIDDLAQYLCMVACRLALGYDITRVKPGYTFASYLYDILQRRCVDWHRLKSEGFLDRRYGRGNPIVLTDDADELVEEAWSDPLTKTIGRSTIARWQAAADAEGLDRHSWIVAALDERAKRSLSVPEIAA